MELLPFADAVRVAVPSEVSDPTDALNLALAVPAGTERLAGVETFLLLLESVTPSPVLGAPVVRDTVQVAEP